MGHNQPHQKQEPRRQDQTFSIQVSLHRVENQLFTDAWGCSPELARLSLTH